MIQTAGQPALFDPPEFEVKLRHLRRRQIWFGTSALLCFAVLFYLIAVGPDRGHPQQEWLVGLEIVVMMAGFLLGAHGFLARIDLRRWCDKRDGKIGY